MHVSCRKFIVKNLILVITIVGASPLALGQATFSSLAISNSFATDLTPDGKYAAVYAGSSYYRWEIGVSATNIGGSHSAGNAYISDDGSRIGGEALDTASKRSAAYYDFGNPGWVLTPQPNGYSTTGLGSNLSGMWGMDSTGTKLGVAAYDTGLKLKPTTYDTVTQTHVTNATLGTSNARPNDLSADGTTLVGWDSNPNTRQAAVWKNGQEVFVDASASEIQATNSDGSLYFGFRGNSATVWDASFNVTTMSLLSGFDRGAVASGTDDGSLLVGYMQNGTNTGTRRGVIWINGTPQLISTYATSAGANLQGFTPITGLRITPNGNTIVGWGTNATGQINSFALNVVPEPASMVVLAVAMTGLVARRRIKK